MLQNLIGNAIKFRRHGIASEIEVSAHRHEYNLIVSIQDNDIGLAVAKKLVKRRGGRMLFESEPGKGTTFFFTIPT